MSLDSEALEGRLSTGCERSELTWVIEKDCLEDLFGQVSSNIVDYKLLVKP